jgi:transcriptional regulator with PAS, ATPase and Fis domain
MRKQHEFAEPFYMREARQAANSDLPVLLTGETGVGKDYLAHFIHSHSVRRTGPFRNVNCAAIPKELFESTLFGHVKGAFTGAEKDQRGHFDAAHGGTLFLNEISLMPPEGQGKLLTALETREYYPVG